MSSTTTVAQFAAELNKSPATLIEQLSSAGVVKARASDPLSEADKQKLLGYLQASHGTASTERKKIILMKKSTTEIKQADASGKARTIQVEVRKKRTFVRREDGTDAASSEDIHAEDVAVPHAAAAAEAELVRREEEANRDAELLRRQEAELAEKRRLRQEQEAQEAALERERQAAAAKKAQEEAQAVAAAKAAAEAEAAKKAAAQAAQAVTKAKPTIGKIEKVAPPMTADVQKAAATAAAAQTSKAAEAAAALAAAKAKATAEFQADAAKALALQERRRKAEAEAAGIRAMLSAPKRGAGAACGPQGGHEGHAAQASGRARRRQTRRARRCASRCACCTR